jgi:hypothetical protein
MMWTRFVAGTWYTLFVNVVWKDDFEGVRSSNNLTVFLSGQAEENQRALRIQSFPAGFAACGLLNASRGLSFCCFHVC